jgi:hypothetical protein
MPERKPRSTLDSLLLEPTLADKKLRTALSQWLKKAVRELGGWANLNAFQQAQLTAAKLSLSIILAEGKVMVECSDLSDRRAVLANRNVEVHQGLLRKYIRDLGLLRPRPRAKRVTTIQDIQEEYRKRERGQ